MARIRTEQSGAVEERFTAGSHEVTMRGDLLSVGEFSFSITNPGKVLWPGEGIIKRDLVAYYLHASPHILPYLSGRPLILQIYNKGISGEPLFIQRRPSGTPEWVKQACLTARAGHEVCHVRADDDGAGVATIAWLASRNCIPLHAWLSREPRLETPDWLAFDLDPSPGATFSQIVRIAGWLHARLSDLGLQAFLKVSGSRGLHIMAPIEPTHSHDEVRSFATAVGQEAVAALPNDATLAWRIEDRGAKVFVDVRRNTYGHSLVVPYSVRPRPGAPVSVALNWDELELQDLSPSGWGMDAALRRLREVGDPFSAAYSVSQRLPSAPRA